MSNGKKKKLSQQAERAAAEAGLKAGDILATTMVRTSRDQEKYEPLLTEDGFLVAVGRPRTHRMDKSVQQLLRQALKAGCALLAMKGGLRVMRGPDGVGGVCFIEQKHAYSGAAIYVFAPADDAEAKKLGMVVTSVEVKKGFRVKLQLDGTSESVFPLVLQHFVNKREAKNFVVFPWPGMEMDESDEEKPAKKHKKHVDGDEAAA